MPNLVGDSSDPQVPAVEGTHNTAGLGLAASSELGIAVRAAAKKDTALFATTGTGVAAIDARNQSGIGLRALREQGVAIRAEGKKDTAVFATTGTGFAAVDARNNAGIGLFAKGGKFAAFFEGVVMVTEDVQLQNADCAEEFSALSGETVEPGTVMVIETERRLQQSTREYDRCVIGVVSGAGDLKPGLVLGKQEGETDRVLIGLVGRVYCKVDASYGPIERGDLLTTSNTPGFAMKASDHSRAFGAVIGKALRGLDTGRGLIPIIVALQ